MARIAIPHLLRHPVSRPYHTLQAHIDIQAEPPIQLLQLAQFTLNQGLRLWKEREATTYYRIWRN